MKRIFWLAVALVAGGVVWWVMRGGAANGRPPAPVTTATVERQDIVVTVETIGEIHPGNQVSIKPEVSGRIKQIHVRTGQTVPQGTLMVALDETDLLTERDAAQTQIAAAQVRLAKAQRDYDRQRDLLASKLISQEALDNALTDLELARTEFDKAQKQLQTVDDKLKKIRILAPFNGTVLSVFVTEGQVVSGATSVSQGTDLLTFADLNALVIRAHINQVDITKVKPDQPVRITVDSLPDVTLTGRVVLIAPVATVKNGIKGFSVDVLITTHDDRIRPGMNAQLQFPVAHVVQALTVPLAAVFHEGGEKVVYVRQPTGAERRVVTVGAADHRRVEILTGLRDGETVLLEPPPAS
jgi:RND family efflux transporter MFP subunit